MKRGVFLLIFSLFIAAGTAKGQLTAGDITGPGSVCMGSSITLTSHATGTGTLTYQWFSSDEGVATVLDGVITTVGPGNADITYKVSDETPSTVTSAAFPVTVNSVASASVSISSSANPVCSGISVTFTASPVDGGTPGYQWYKNSSPVGTNSIIYSDTPADGDEYYVIMTSSLPCVSGSPATSAKITMTVNDNSPVGVSISADANPVCSGTTVTYTATPVNGGVTPSYQWYKNSNPVGTNSSNYSDTPADGDKYYVIMTSSLPCVSGNPATSAKITMTVNDNSPVGVSISADADPVCSGTTVTYTATPVNGGVTPSYQWYKNSIAAGTGETYAYVPTTGDVVHVVLTSSLSSCLSTNPATSSSLVVVVNPLPTVSAGAGIGAICQGATSASLGGSFGGGATSAVWTSSDPGGSFSNNAGTTPGTATYTASASSPSSVTLTLTSSGGSCGIVIASKTITVNPVPTISTVSQTGLTCHLNPGIIHLTGLPISTSLTIHYKINEVSQTAVSQSSDAYGVIDFNTRNLTNSADNGKTLEITSITVLATTCTTNFTDQKCVLNVAPDITYSDVIQADACNGSGSFITLTGLCPNTTFDINYTIDGSPYSATSVGSDGIGTASFMSVPFVTANNGKRLYIKKITINGTACFKTYNDYTNITVNSVPAPLITGPSSACQGSTGKVYTTNSGMDSYTWSVTGGSITAGAGTKSITVTWTAVGTGIVSVTCVNGLCNGTSPDYNVNVGLNSSPAVTGSGSTCVNSTGNLYTTAAGNSNYVWSVSAGGTITSDPNGNFITVTWTTSGPKTVKVHYTTPLGCITGDGSLSVNVHALPIVSVTSADLYADIPRITKSVTYTTQAGMSAYNWQISAGGSGSSSGNSITVTWNNTGPQSVYVNYVDGNGCTASSPSRYLPDINVKPLPSISGVSISGDPYIGTLLQGAYSWDEGSASPDASTYKWFRNGILIATTKNYTPVYPDDLDKTLTFQVTPVSSIDPGFPGTAVISAGTQPVEYLVGNPVADQVCIEGKRIVDSVLTGKYRYTYIKSEGSSIHKWFRKNLLTGDSTIIGYGNKYKLVSLDLAANTEISFTVYPVSSNIISRSGTKASSKYLARIIGLKDQYSMADESQLISSNVTGGFFSGDAIVSNIFTPKSAGVGDHLINYFKFYEYSNYTCNQRATQKVTVSPNEAVFSAMKDVYCFDDPPFIVTVSGVPALSSSFRFICSDANLSAIEEIDSYTVKVYPEKMKPSVTQRLTYSYKNALGNNFEIYEEFIVDKVSKEIKFLGLDTSYCSDEPRKYISLENLYPLGGKSHWSTSLISDTTVASAYFNPNRGTPKTTYQVFYRYTSPLGCRSNLISIPVNIKPLPKATFDLNPNINIDGGPVILLPDQTGGIFSGDGVSGSISAQKILPDEAGLGPHSISYSIRDRYGCDDTLNVLTTVRKALATFNGIPADICYGDITYDVSVTNLPTGDPFEITGFTNTKNSLVYTHPSATAKYGVIAAGQGDDELVFSYKWFGVDFSIKKKIFVDKLEQVVIGGISPDKIICTHVGKIELFPSIPDGTFSGPVTGGFLDPGKAVPGVSAYTVSYTYTNPKTLCATSASVPIKIFPSPKVDFSPDDVCIQDENDPTHFINKTTSNDPVESWKWNFTEAGNTSSNTTKDASYIYKTGGLLGVSLQATTVNTCVVTKDTTYNLARKPIADFYVKMDCYKPDEMLLLKDTSKVFTASAKAWEWKINGSVVGNANKATYLKSDTGYLRVEYTVKTDPSYGNCNATIAKNVYIRPTITLQKDGYFEDFERGRNGWTKTDALNIWSFGKPDGTDIKTAASGYKAWFTKDVKKGSAEIESP
ncbi:MAG: hypothetical protein ACM3NR_04165, partial [Methanosarcina sp.]